MRRKNCSAIGLSVLATAAVSAMTAEALSATLTYDTSSAAGITTTSGTWDYNTTARWSGSQAGSDPLLVWNDNADVADFIASASNATITVNNNAGQVGAAGLTFSGSGAGTLTIAGSTLQVGSQGISSTMSAGIISITAPVELAGSLTVTSNQLRFNNGTPGGAAVRLMGGVSTASGTTNLTFDGQGLSNATATGNGENRVIFSLGGTNTFSGATTVTGGAALRLDYNSGVTPNTSRLADASALILAGGSIVLNNGPSTDDLANGAPTVNEIVGSTTVARGANTVYLGPSGGGGNRSRIQLNAITQTAGAGGVFDVSNAASGIAFTTTINTNGIIGGWATLGGGNWAVGSADGSATAITNTNGTTQAPANWTATMNVNADANASAIASKTINVLRLNNANRTLTFAADATLTLASGGLIGGTSSGQSIAGGSVTSGLASGELFVHTPSSSFTLASSVVDNGSTPTTLVKAGKNDLLLSGNSTYTGGTIINSGTLQLTGSLATADITIEGGTFAGNGTLHYRLSDDNADLVSIVGGLFDLSGLNLNLVTSGTQTQQEYVIADRPVGSPYVTGATFATVAGLPTGWSIDYDGTASNPGRVVLVTAVPEPATAGVLGLLAAVGLTRRRRC